MRNTMGWISSWWGGSSILRFLDNMLLPIVIFLEDIIGNTDGNILSKCNRLLQSILNIEFWILSLEVAVEILSIYNFANIALTTRSLFRFKQMYWNDKNCIGCS